MFVRLSVAALSAAVGLGQSPSPPPAAAPAPQPATFAPCASPRPQFAALAVDPAAPLDVLTSQQFVVALRVASDSGFRWELLSGAGRGTIVRAEGTRTLVDIAFQNLDRPGQPPLTGGNATQLWLFTAVAPGTATLSLGLMAPGATAPERTMNYTVRISPNVAIC
jgi:predicted secreted protein